MSGTHTEPASRVVVTGGSGFLGSHLVERLVARGDRVTVVDAVPPPAHAIARKHAEFIAADVRDAVALAAAIGRDVDTVYHLAAVVGVDTYLARPADVITTNFTGTRSVLEAVNRASARLVLASTSEVFGKNPEVPWREDADRVLGPTSAARWSYSTSKALSEHLALAYAEQYGLPVTIVRYFNAYGPGQRPAYVVSRSVHRALNGRPPVVYDDGRQTRCFTYVDDVVDGTMRAADSVKAIGESFNLGTMVESTVGELAALVCELTGLPAPTTVDTGRLGSAYQDIPRRVPDNTKAADLLGWVPRTDLRTGLAATVAWAREHPEWLALPESGVS